MLKFLSYLKKIFKFKYTDIKLLYTIIKKFIPHNLFIIKKC